MAKEGSSDYKKVRKRWFFKEPLTEWFFVEPKMVLLWHRLKNLLKHLYFFKSVDALYYLHLVSLFFPVVCEQTSDPFLDSLSEIQSCYRKPRHKWPAFSGIFTQIHQ